MYKVTHKGIPWHHRNTSSTGVGVMVLIIMAIVIIGNVYGMLTMSKALC